MANTAESNTAVYRYCFQYRSAADGFASIESACYDTRALVGSGWATTTLPGPGGLDCSWGAGSVGSQPQSLTVTTVAPCYHGAPYCNAAPALDFVHIDRRPVGVSMLLLSARVRGEPL